MEHLTKPLKYELFTSGGKLIKDNDQYELYDNNSLEHLVVSETRLRSGKSTNGHRHEDQEEVYIFTSGKGKMEIDHLEFEVNEGDVILVPGGAFHKVHNTGDFFLRFICIFEGKRSH